MNKASGFQDSEIRGSFDVALRESKASNYWCVLSHVSVQQAHLFLDPITPFHFHQYSPTDIPYYDHTTSCALVTDSQSLKIRPLTTSSHSAFFSNHFRSHCPTWRALEETAPCQLMAPSQNSSTSL